MANLRGIIAPFTTPFKENGEIDLNLIKPQVDWLIENDAIYRLSTMVSGVNVG